MIPSLDSPNYAPLLEPQSTNVATAALNTTSEAAPTAAVTSLSLANSAIKTPSGASVAKLQKLFDAVTRMLQALALVLQQRNAMKTQSAPSSATSTTPKPATPSSPASTPWLTPVDQEPTLVVPDLDHPPTQTPITTPPPSDPATSANPPGTPVASDLTSTAASTSPSTGTPPGAATLPIDSKEAIPDLDGVNQPPAGSTQYSIGTRLKGSGQFLWKPVSDKDGKLAVLIPPKLTGKVKSVVILSPDKTKVLSKGTYSGVGNGNREHFRFSKAGGQYPDKAIVMITLKDGSTQYVTIRNTSARYTQ